MELERAEKGAEAGAVQHEIARGGTLRVELVDPDARSGSQPELHRTEPSLAQPPSPALPRPGMLRTQGDRRMPEFRLSTTAAHPTAPTASGQIPRGVVPGVEPAKPNPQDTLAFIDDVMAGLVGQPETAASASQTESAGVSPPRPEPKRRATRRSSIAGAVAACAIVLGLSWAPSLLPSAAEDDGGREDPAVQAALTASRDAVPTAVATIVASESEHRSRRAEQPEPEPAQVAEPEPEPAQVEPAQVAEPEPAQVESAQTAKPDRRSERRAERPHRRSRSRKAERKHIPATSAATERAAKPDAKTLLREAKQALARGQDAQAYRLARQSHRRARGVAALRVMTLSACGMGRKDTAKSAFKRLSWNDRRGLRGACRERGVNLGL